MFNTQIVARYLSPLQKEDASYPTLLILIAGIVTLCTACNLIYNIFFHPLASFPGPWLARSSLLWRVYHSQSGRLHRAIETQHRKYGPVFRVSPNELSFASVASWKDIYGFAGTHKQQTFVKSTFYNLYGAGFRSLCVGSERDPRRHGGMRKSLSSAFSTKSLTEQEDIVSNTVDRFISRIRTVEGAKTKGLNITKWFEMVSFDVLAEMAFGSSFGSIEAGRTHSWPDLVVEHLYFITLADNLHRIPLVPTIARILFPSLLVVQNSNSRYARQQVAKRLEKESPRKDFLMSLIAKLKEGQMELEELTAHSSTLVIAGGETTATTLAATTFYLLQNPECYEKLKHEVRERFKTYESINSTAALQLPYLQAVISEGLRIYPPGSQGFPRISPGAVVDGNYIPKGTEVYTSAWTITHDPNNFHDPMAFKPDRWIDKDCKDIKEASQPFSLGTRGCLGRNFAYMQLSLMFTKMLWKYDLELLDKDLDWEGRSKMHLMWWKPSAYVRFIERAA
ncbi:cytochrome P450 monooxygenase [Periconia macrospinosa]|uniref:Cytochrome P450 monooxygenase n=1 Tax=Periconia macrospinosa TaxID=97972 RepID=A0A2V1D4X3_9PLEO|nr:cytochrome P450 monooxygenase [Periconia macrospinosa]